MIVGYEYGPQKRTEEAMREIGGYRNKSIAINIIQKLRTPRYTHSNR